MKDFKMMVPETMREEVQQRLFDCECRWIDGDVKVTEERFYFIYIKNNFMTYGYIFSNFLDEDLPEITLTEFMELTEQEKQSDLDYDSVIDDILNDPEKSEILVTKLFKKLRGEN